MEQHQTKKLFNSQRNERINSTDGEKALRSYVSDKELISMIYYEIGNLKNKEKQ